MTTSRMALVISCFGLLVGCAATTPRAADPTTLAAGPETVSFHILRSGPRIDVVEISADGEASRSATFNGRKLITAPTAAVQKFVVAHKDRFTSEFPLQKQEPRN